METSKPSKKISTLLTMTAGCLLITLSSCASFAGLGGKAHYIQTFEDTTAVDQKTAYRLDIKGPAGMKWEEITGMAYEWNQSDGKISINSQSKADTIATAEAIKAVVPALTETVSSAIGAGIQAALTQIMPVIAQKIEAETAARIATTQIKADAIKEVTKVVVPKQPEVPAVVPLPVVPDPVVDAEPPVIPPLAPGN